MKRISMSALGSTLILVIAFASCALAVDAPASAVAATTAPISSAVVLYCPTTRPAEFEKVAALAKEIGATDVDVSDLPEDRWQWFDPADPYPNWSMLARGILKIMAPPELQPAVPTDVARRDQQILAQRGEVLGKLGLKAYLRVCEPMWLPEAVYQKHPDWRGPTCQAPERSRHNYYAPDIDNPQVLALYRNATAQLCRLVPIDEFNILAGDSGSGISWDPGLYTGANGPAYCKDRPLIDRINGFMDAIRAGAKQAVLDATITIGKYRSPAPGRPQKVVAAGLQGYYFWDSKVYPIVGMSDPVRFAADLEKVFDHPEAEWNIGVPSLDCTTYFDLIRLYRNSPVQGPLQRMQALNTVATRQVGQADAGHLVQAWQEIHEAILLLEQIDNGGPILLLGSVNQRWLVRPLVPFPLELSADEKDYYRRFQFQANTEENAANLMNLQGLYAISGDAGTRLAHDLFAHTIKHLASARGELKVILGTNEKLAEISALDLRIQALILVIKNADITARYQAYLEHFTPGCALRPDRHGHPNAADGKAIVAEDQANTRDLIALLKSTPVSLIDVAPSAREEDVFRLNPDLIGQLQKKIEIEEAHLADHYRL
jgi:hypothetical protein